MNLTQPQQEALFTICLMAAFADGGKSDLERAELKRIAESLLGEELHAATIYQNVLLKKTGLEDAVRPLEDASMRQLAYEMAVCVCDADDATSPAEKEFLKTLQAQLGLAADQEKELSEPAEELAIVPLQPPPLPVATMEVPPATAQPATPAAPELDGMILKYAILNGALELLPDSLATMAIIPLQMKMVYRIGKHHGIELDRGHIKEFAATAGIGLTSQVVEGFARKLVKGFVGKALGKGLVRSASEQLTSSAFSFASTYALGQVAKAYYAGGRKLPTQDLRALFDTTASQAKELHSRYLPQIQDQARGLDTAKILSMVKGGGM